MEIKEFVREFSEKINDLVYRDKGVELRLHGNWVDIWYQNVRIGAIIRDVYRIARTIGYNSRKDLMFAVWEYEDSEYNYHPNEIEERLDKILEINDKLYKKVKQIKILRRKKKIDKDFKVKKDLQKN